MRQREPSARSFGRWAGLCRPPNGARILPVRCRATEKIVLYPSPGRSRIDSDSGRLPSWLAWVPIIGTEREGHRAGVREPWVGYRTCIRRSHLGIQCPVAEICRHFSADPSQLTALPSLAVHHWYDSLRRLVSRAPWRPNFVNLSLRRDTSPGSAMSKTKKPVEQGAGIPACDQEDLRAALIGQVVHPYIEGQKLQSERPSRPDPAPDGGAGRDRSPGAQGSPHRIRPR